ncbi:S8 family serine peptidase [Sneathiella limimaris]|uniref:S8 family serine peptidase n=1 Tax=Sneathiella limimaris TaxID=1964213 RepID=UPI00146AB289|nr:S8 family serine peptidase [Sneathiella limimaris]
MQKCLLILSLFLMIGTAAAQTRSGSVPGTAPGTPPAATDPTGAGQTGSSLPSVPSTSATPERDPTGAPLRETSRETRPEPEREPQRVPARVPERPSAKEPETDRAPSQQRDVRIPQPAPTQLQFARVMPGCVSPGQTFLIQGQGFANLDPVAAFINSPSQKIRARIVGVSPTQIALQLPKAPELQSQSYGVTFATKGATVETDTQLSLRPCGERTGVSRAELLMMGPLDQFQAVTAELAARNLQVSESYDLQGFAQFLLVVEAIDAQTLIAEFQTLFPDVTIDFNSSLEAASTPAPRLFAKSLVNWPDKAQCAQAQAEIKIGLLDGVVERTHPAFQSGSIVGELFIKDARPDLGHGTAIASILIGDAPDLGISGLLPKATIYNAVVLRESQAGPLASVKAIVRGLDWLAVQKVRLVGVSLATLSQNRVLERASRFALQQGMILFAAAGNNGPEAGSAYPAAYPGVFAVTAVDAAKRLYQQANVGDYISFAAPGVDVWVATPDGSGAYKTGTSFATPYAMATAALFLARNPSLSRQVLEKVLAQTVTPLGEPGEERLFGKGLLQAKC